MSKIEQRARQVLEMWEEIGFEDEPKEEKVQVLTHAIRQSVLEVLDWTSKYVKPYTTAWDEGQKARAYMDHVQTFKEKL